MFWYHRMLLELNRYQHYTWNINIETNYTYNYDLF